jgi:hypothetical protein
VALLNAIRLILLDTSWTPTSAFECLWLFVMTWYLRPVATIRSLFGCCDSDQSSNSTTSTCQRIYRTALDRLELAPRRHSDYQCLGPSAYTRSLPLNCTSCVRVPRY